MSDFETTSFEVRFERRVQAYANIHVRAVDAAEIARTTVARHTSWRAPNLSRFAAKYVLILIGILLALLGAALLGSIVLRDAPDADTVLPGRNGAIVYSSYEGTEERPSAVLYLINPDGSLVKRITGGLGSMFSRDGSALAYWIGDRNARLYVADFDGADPIQLPDYNLSGYALSPDGSHVALQLDDLLGNSSGSISLVDVAQGTVRSLIGPPTVAGVNYDLSSASFSPDGRWLAFASTRDIPGADNPVGYGVTIVDVAAGNVVSTQRLGDPGYGRLTWSPDSSSVAFAAWLSGTAGSNALFAFGTDGTPERRLTSGTEGAITHMSWSPDGNSIAHLEYVGDGFRLVLTDLYGQSEASSTRLGPGAGGVTWSPDGKQLLFVSWVPDEVPNGSDPDTFHLQVIDREVAPEPRSLASSDWPIDVPSWQWLEP